jgi:hypothetical protein
VFLRTLNAQSIVFATTFAVLFLFLYLNFRIARGTFRRPHRARHGGWTGGRSHRDVIDGVALPAAW